MLIAILIAGTCPLFAQPNPEKPITPASVGLEKALLFYGELSGRTVLCHPALARMPLAFSSASTNRAEILTSIEAALDKQGVAMIRDGEKFVLVGLKSQAAVLVPGATNLPATKTKPYAKGTIDFHNASITPVLSVYAAILGKKLDQTNPLPVAGEVTLIQTCELTKEEILYAFETLMRWKDWELISVNEQTVRVVPRPRPAVK